MKINKNKNGNTKGGLVELVLKNSDKSHLYKFLSCVGCTEDIVKDKTTKLNGKTYEACRVTLNSIDFARDLEKHGCVQNKSLILKRPNIDKSLFSHFIRGYFDGDGGISFNYESNAAVSYFIGTYDILNFIKENSNISNYISVRRVVRDGEDKNFFSLTIGGKKSIIALYEYMYMDASIFLERKYKKYTDAYNYLIKNTN